MSQRCGTCSTGPRCDRCRQYTAEAVARSRLKSRAAQIISVATPPRPDPWLLPDDDVLDQLAVQVAASGERKVRLTAAERLAAAILILAGRGTVRDVCVRLSLPVIVSEDDLCQISPQNSEKKSVPSAV